MLPPPAPMTWMSSDRHADGEAGDEAPGREARGGAPHQRDIRARTADVEGHDVRISRLPGRLRSSDHARRRARQAGSNREAASGVEGHHAAVGMNGMRRDGDPECPQAAHQRFEVA